MNVAVFNLQKSFFYLFRVFESGLNNIMAWHYIFVYDACVYNYKKLGEEAKKNN